MSDYLAVGGVSAVLKSLLTTALAAGGPSTILNGAAGITNVAPDLIATGTDEAAQVNVFLYYASINPALHPRQLNPYRPPATIALRMRLNGNGPWSAHSSRHSASVARLRGVSE